MGRYLRKFSGTLAALVIFAILLGGVLYYDSQKKTAETPPPEKVFPGVKPDDILSIKIVYPEEKVSLEKTDGKWYVVQGGGRHEADSEMVHDIVNDLSEMEADRVVSTDETDLDEFGFVKSKREFTVVTDELDYPVIIGDKSPVGSGIYVYDLGEGRVILVKDHYLWGILNGSPEGFRDRDLTGFDREAVDRIVVRAGAFSVELRKENGRWVQSGAESPGPIDQKKVDEILDSFTGLEASEFVADETDDLAAYGLDEPVAEAGFFGEGISETVFFGKRMDEDNFYVKTSEGEAVYAVPKEHFGILPKNLDQIAVSKLPR
ncbi:MAG: DUF4340 domain-containing protein [Candidatus Dadabacteria bacterium]|nr:DUF4340 domain-containing protein [Candidatus Dadabacteria bacterium]